jgi:hypothetical protein
MIVFNWMFISGMVVGIELLEDDESNVLCIDLLILRLIWEKYK